MSLIYFVHWDNFFPKLTNLFSIHPSWNFATIFQRSSCESSENFTSGCYLKIDPHFAPLSWDGSDYKIESIHFWISPWRLKNPSNSFLALSNSDLVTVRNQGWDLVEPGRLKSGSKRVFVPRTPQSHFFGFGRSFEDLLILSNECVCRSFASSTSIGFP